MLRPDPLKWSQETGPKNLISYQLEMAINRSQLNKLV